jgi:hypothetical protein
MEKNYKKRERRKKKEEVNSARKDESRPDASVLKRYS